jgi:uncharacterized protein DUF4402
MRKSYLFSAAAAAVLSLAGEAGLQAQSASIQALANVFAPITIAGARNLDFGNVFPGVNKAIAVADPTSGRFDLTGQSSANLNLTFTLPGTLTSGGNNLTIGTWTGCTNPTTVVAGCTSIDPTVVSPTAFSAGGGLVVWVGATVSPTAAQAPGNYTGTVSLSVAYF